MPETGSTSPKFFLNLKINHRRRPPANLSLGEQKGGGQSEQKQTVRAPPEYPGVAITLPSILLKSPLTLHQMIHLRRDQADVLAEPHRHQDVQGWSGDLDDSRAQFIDQVGIDLLLRQIP
jgi:hypothetical protein